MGSPSSRSRRRRRRRPLVCIAGLACASKVEVRTVLSVCAKRRFAGRYESRRGHPFRMSTSWGGYESCARLTPGSAGGRQGDALALYVPCLYTVRMRALYILSVCALGSRPGLFLPYCAAREDSACVFLLLLSLWC